MIAYTIIEGDRVIVTGWQEQLAHEALVVAILDDYSVMLQPADSSTKCIAWIRNLLLLPGGQMLKHHTLHATWR